MELKKRRSDRIAARKNVSKAAVDDVERGVNGRGPVREVWWRKNSKLIGTVGVIVVILLIVVGIVVGNLPENIPEGFYTSNDRMTVLSLTPDVASFEENEEYRPMITHIVYYNNGGEDVTNAKIYFEYSNPDEAKAANEKITLDQKNWASGKQLNGKYIVFSMKPEQYRDLKMSQVNDNINAMRAAGTTTERTVEEKTEESEPKIDTGVETEIQN